MRQIVVLELVDPLQVELDVGLALPTERPKFHCISLTAMSVDKRSGCSRFGTAPGGSSRRPMLNEFEIAPVGDAQSLLFRCVGRQ